MPEIKAIKVSLEVWKELMALSFTLEEGKRVSMSEVIAHLLKAFKGEP